MFVKGKTRVMYTRKDHLFLGFGGISYSGYTKISWGLRLTASMLRLRNQSSVLRAQASGFTVQSGTQTLKPDPFVKRCAMQWPCQIYSAFTR